MAIVSAKLELIKLVGSTAEVRDRGKTHEDLKYQTQES